MTPSLNYRLWRIGVRTAARVFWNWRVLHSERIPSTGPVILAASHVSYGDPPLIGSAIGRTTHFLARESLFGQPLFGAWLRSLNTLPVDREGGSAAGLRAVMEILQRGELVLLFPEGTRSSDGNLQRLRPGVGLIALKSAAPVVPVRVFGLFEIWGRHRTLPGPGRMIVKFGHPLSFGTGQPDAPPAGIPHRSRNQWVADKIFDALEKLDPSEDMTRFP